MVKSRRPIRPADLLRRFAEMAERSRSIDGDRQGDGWGIGRLDEMGEWMGFWSLSPVWEEASSFDEIPAGRLFLIHARSASFPHQKGRLDYNQPYLSKGRAFVFNGLLRGVSLKKPVPGDIGAQKIWNLFETLKPSASPARRLSALIRSLEENSKQISALNLGLAGARGAYAYCRSGPSGDYYRLQAAETPQLRMICSESLSGFDFRPMPTDTVVRI